MSRRVSISGYEFRDDVESMLSLFMAAGADAIEVWPWNMQLGVEKLLELLDGCGMAATCVSTGADLRINADPLEKCREVLNRTIDSAVELGAPFVTTYMGENPLLDIESAIEEFGVGIAPCARRASERNVTLLIENMFDSRNEDPSAKKPLRTVDGTLRTLERLSEEGIGLTFDPCNFYIAGEDPIEGYRTLAPFIRNFHVKDAVPASGESTGGACWIDSIRGKFLSVVAGMGHGMLGQTIGRAVEDGFPGPFTIDIMTTEATREPMYMDSTKYLENALGRSRSGTS